MAEPTIMVLKVDLGCNRCYRKVKKLLCKFPEIRDQVFYEKEDTVMIKVVCCSPERIRSKLICKGGKTIKSIEIKVPEKPKEAEKPKPPPEKPKEAEKPKPPPEKPKEAEKPKPPPEKPPEKPKEPEKPKPKAKPDKNIIVRSSDEKPDHTTVNNTVKKQSAEDTRPPPGPTPLLGLPLNPIGVCCKPYYEGRGGGPSHHGYGIPYRSPSYDGYVRLVVPSYDGPYSNWASGSCRCNRCYDCRCEYFTEENPTCTIM